MLVRITGGNDGIAEYLITGHKGGREYTREELDERVILAGDLDATDAVIQSIDSAGDRYLHITLSFKEDHLHGEVLQQTVAEFEAFAFTAYRSDEYSFYAEAHLPRIKAYTNRRTGEFIERKPHIHIVIPNRNLLNGRHLNLLGKSTQQERFIDAFQEHMNNKFGLASPKQHRRVEFTDASEMIARYRGDAFTGSNREFRADLLASVIDRDIRSVDEFEGLLREHGDVRIRNAGKPSQYFNVKQAGKEKGINLKDYVFSREFIGLPQSDKRDAITRDIQRRYEEAGAAKRDPVAIAEALHEWHEIRAKEVKYINSGNIKAYRVYRAADREQQLAALADREARYYAKHDAATARIEDETMNQHQSENALIERASGTRTVIPFDRRMVDNVVGQLQHEAHEAGRRRNADTRVELADIKRMLDARRLLAAMGATHGVLAEKYEVTKGRDGGDRITCGSRHLNVSDFLTHELKLPWSTAEQILRDEHARQARHESANNVPSAPGRSPLWADFQQWKRIALPERKAQAWDQQRAGEQGRRRAITVTFQERKSAIYAAGVKHPQRRAALSIARMEKVEADKALRAAIAKERVTLKARHNLHANELFRTYLQERANDGDAAALGELRRQRLEPERHDRLPNVTTGDPMQRDWRGGQDVLNTGPTSYRVERNGDVTYRIADRDVLRDEARAVKFLAPKERDVLETGLRLALQKFGPKIQVSGSEEFAQRIVQSAVECGLRVDFVDSALQAFREKLEAERRPAAPPPKVADAVTGATASRPPTTVYDWSPIMRGDPGSREVHLVERGVDALALRDIHRREHPNQPLPTVIVTGGARTLKWQDNPEAAQMLRDAQIVSIHTANERDGQGRPDPTRQQATDDAHEKQAQAVARIRGTDNGIQFERPQLGIKDMAERNLTDLKIAAEREKEQERQRAERHDDEQHHRPRMR